MRYRAAKKQNEIHLDDFASHAFYKRVVGPYPLRMRNKTPQCSGTIVRLYYSESPVLLHALIPEIFVTENC